MTNEDWTQQLDSDLDEVDRADRHTTKHIKQIMECQVRILRSRPEETGLRRAMVEKSMGRCERITKDVDVLMEYIEKLEEELGYYDEDEDEEAQAEEVPQPF